MVIQIKLLVVVVEFLTNPSSWVAFGSKTMSIVGGQMNNIQPSCVAG